MTSRNRTALYVVAAVLIFAALFALILGFDHGAGTYCAQRCVSA